MLEVFDIVTCPVCGGEKTVDGGRMMKDAKVYAVIKVCPECKGKGKIGIKRQEPEKTKEVIMIGRIDSNGCLHIVRGSKEKEMFCLMDTEDKLKDTGTKNDLRCGDWCPQFGEPYGVVDPEGLELCYSGLAICQSKHLKFTSLTDERSKNEDK